MGLRLRFSESDWERIWHDWTAWWEGALDRPMVVLECTERLDRYDPQCASVFLGNYPMDTPAATILDEFVPRLENTHYLGIPSRVFGRTSGPESWLPLPGRKFILLGIPLGSLPDNPVPSLTCA